ncbi:MAG: hypothetical protein M0Q44_07255 [Methylobacter sp.]|jgi:hypothetical protein|nr:hypothetical protein [Methylobacter sp.]
MTLWKKIIIGITVIVILFIGGVILFVRSLPDMCGNEILFEFPSSNMKMKAVAFLRDCGATTDFSTQVTILPINDVLQNEGGNTFSADTNYGAAPSGQGGGPEVRLRWLSDTQLQIQYHRSARIFKSKIKIKGVDIAYLTFQ